MSVLYGLLLSDQPRVAVELVELLLCGVTLSESALLCTQEQTKRWTALHEARKVGYPCGQLQLLKYIFFIWLIIFLASWSSILGIL